MFKIPLVTSEKIVDINNFWNAIFLYHSSPHVVNRRLLGISQLFFLKVNFYHDVYDIKDVLQYSELSSQVHKLESLESKNINESIITNICHKFSNNFTYEITSYDNVKRSNDETFISVRILLPRGIRFPKSIEFVIIDKRKTIATFIAISVCEKFLSPNFRYDIELNRNNQLRISVLNNETAQRSESTWLGDILFPKIWKWTEKIDVAKPVQRSLSLISEEKYCNLYHELKLKYGKNIVKIWPENTDPYKFVYEDVAIATYLLLLWKRTSKTKQRFVDLGCGNGLLVHILSQEGHDGYGIDVRPRKIWKMFPETTKLNVETIVPSSKFLYPDRDWIIGNHSDELSPWIPVIAARSSENCSYFLLPCCSYEFNGKKYQRYNTSISQYEEYLEYIKSISDVCGFITEVDRLRIPSTKRICLVGSQRKCNDFIETNKHISNFINNRCGYNSSTHNWVNNYEARPSVEKVRNCTKLNKILVDSIVQKVIKYLLSHDNYTLTTSNKNWNAGGNVTLANLVQVVPCDELKQLKQECGGLQTLLKNHHYIFLVQKGTVQFRIPSVSNKNVVKTKDCWFHKYHPDGCPLNEDECRYIHN